MQPFAQAQAVTIRLFAILAVASLTACATSQDPSERSNGINDPYEAQNRQIHAFNKSLDRGLLRPAATGYSSIVPGGVRTGVNNFSDNLSMPAVAVNSLLQGDIRDASIATLRFVLNTTVGLGGVINAATEFKVAEVDTDFGETLAVWGVGEGAFLELPLLGPSTQRAAIGKVVDIFTNPLTYDIDEPEKYYPPATSALSQLNNRARFGDTVDSLLYESADSYAQTRSIYLQNRRFKLGQDSDDGSFDPYSDPYEDPYEQ